ncbi:MAG: Chromate resistance protein ChrB [Ethanoligenens sp.]|uniref:Chromate resistance protein ChrB n=1 Tax=Ethanoligenens sp. TaxID=2099655 RepID=UPI0039ED92EC
MTLSDAGGTADWAALVYKLPSHPSKYRVYVWRKLKQAGAICYQQGMAVLPMNMWNNTYLESLRGEIRLFGGEATVLRVNFTDKQDEEKLVEHFNDNVRSVCQEISCSLRDFLTEVEQSSQMGYLKKRQDIGFFERARNHYEAFKRHGFFQAPLDQSLGNAVESLLFKIENHIRGYHFVK